MMRVVDTSPGLYLVSIAGWSNTTNGGFFSLCTLMTCTAHTSVASPTTAYSAPITQVTLQ